MTTPSIVVLGGGYGGIRVAKELDDVARVTLVDPKDAFVHNVAAWRALVEPSRLDQLFLPYDGLLERGRFVQGRAVAVEPGRVELASGEVLEADYLVLATGSAYAFPAKSPFETTAAARERWHVAHDVLLAAESVLVVGAGPAGLELAGEIGAFFPEKRVTLVDSGTDVLHGPYDDALRGELRRQLDELGVELMLETRVAGLPDAEPGDAGAIAVTTAAGDTLTADVWYRCFGRATQTGYLRGALAAARNGNGYLRVDEHLRVAGAERIFAIGDVSDAGRDMAGVATTQARIVAESIRALTTGTADLAVYRPGPPAIAVSLGPNGGAGQAPARDGFVGAAVIADIKARSLLLSYVLRRRYPATPSSSTRMGR